MHRPKFLGGLALASMMLVVLTGCPSVIQNVVGASESIQQAINDADAGDTIKVQGSHDEDVTVNKDDVTITGENGAEIDGDTTVNGDNVTIENVTITGTLDTTPGSFNNLTLSNVTVGGWNNASVSGTFSCTRVVQPNGSISTAIGNSGAGDTVCVAPGTYNDKLVIDKELTLTSFNGPNQTEIVDNANQQFDQTILVDGEQGATDVTIDGFTIRNPDTSGSETDLKPERAYGIRAEGNADNVSVRNVIVDGVKGKLRAVGVGIDAVRVNINQTSNVTISNPVLDGSIVQNVVTTGGGKAKGVSVNGNITGARITNNQISNIGDKNDTDKSRGITLSENKNVAPVVGPTNFEINQNTIDNIAANSTDNGLETSAALFVGDYETLGNNHSFQQNNILDGRVDRCCGGSPDDALLATNNWWGDASGPSGDNTNNDFAKDPNTDALADGSGSPVVPRGLQNSAEANVRFDPWETSAF